MESKSLSNKIFGTLGATILSMVFQVFTLLMTTRYLDVDERGMISIFVLNAAIMAQMSGFCSASLVYMVNREPLKSLLIPCYLCTFLSGIATFLILTFAGQIEPGFELLVLGAGLLQGFYSTNQQIILGKNNIRLYNFTQIFINGVVFLILAYLMFVEESRNVADYFMAYVGAHAITWIIGLAYILPKLDKGSFPDMSIVRKLFGFGLTIQTGTFAQQLNNRFSFYILVESHFATGKFLVGLFSVGLMIIEKLMFISRSFSSVQYAAISKSGEHDFAADVSKSLAKFAFLLTALGALVAFFIPESLYLDVVGLKYDGVKEVVVTLAPGIVVLSISNILSHYFAGLGLYRYNTIGSLAGLVITIACGIMIIPTFGIIGAIVTTNLSYLALTTYQMIEFYKRTRFSWSDWMVTRKDWYTLADKLSIKR